jgi:hypothetical protein
VLPARYGDTGTGMLVHQHGRGRQGELYDRRDGACSELLAERSSQERRVRPEGRARPSFRELSA